VIPREELDSALFPESSQRSRAVEFLDAHGVCWRVVERDARGDPGARGEWCLIFSCDEAVRRVWDYPAGWRDLSAEALMTLSWGR
jgi:hypothetical protein